MLGEKDLEFYKNENLRKYLSEDDIISLLTLFRASNYNYYFYTLATNTFIFKYKSFDELKRMISKLIEHHFNRHVHNIMMSNIILETKSIDEIFELVDDLRKHKYNDSIAALYLQEDVIRNRTQKEMLGLSDFLRDYNYNPRVYDLIKKNLVLSKVNQSVQLQIVRDIIKSDFNENALVLYDSMYVLNIVDSETFLSMMDILKSSDYNKWMLNLAISKIQGRSNNDRLLLMQALLDTNCEPICFRVATNQTIIRYRSLDDQIKMMKYCHQFPSYVVYLFCENLSALETLSPEDHFKLMDLLLKYNGNDYVYAHMLAQIKEGTLTIDEQIKNVEDNEVFKFYLKDNEEK